jgi:MerR family transcriptional regulator/heat shock protein HspR
MVTRRIPARRIKRAVRRPEAARPSRDPLDVETAAGRQTTMTQERFDEQDPCYVISIAARMVGMHQQTLRYYERVGLIEPSRSRGNIRLYSHADISRLRQIQRLISDLGVNLAGVEVIIRMGQKMQELEAELQRYRAEVEYCQANHQDGRQLEREQPRR